MEAVRPDPGIRMITGMQEAVRLTFPCSREERNILSEIKTKNLYSKLKKLYIIKKAVFAIQNDCFSGAVSDVRSNSETDQKKPGNFLKKCIYIINR